MLTFLEFYQTLLGFVFFKLYTDIGLVYPPPMDISKIEAAAGVGAFSLQSRTNGTAASTRDVVKVAGKNISGKDVRRTIKDIGASTTAEEDIPESGVAAVDESMKDISGDDDFVPQPSKTQPDEGAPTALPSLKALMEQAPSANTQLFAPYTFFLSRETPRPLMEFIIRAFGGRIGWSISQGSGSPFQEDDESITHVIVDRPVQQQQGEQSEEQPQPPVEETEEKRRLRLRRKYVQPQWVVDSINQGKILPEELYGQGQTLPPHLSPFGGEEGGYDPADVAMNEGEAEGVSSDEEEEAKEEVALVKEDDIPVEAEEVDALRTAELKAEAAGVDYDTFEKAVRKKTKKLAKEKGLDRYGESPCNVNLSNADDSSFLLFQSRTRA